MPSNPNSNKSSNVSLCFATELQPNKLFSLKRQFLPLGKVGGLPSWLNPVNLPASKELLCKVCDKPLAFLLQVYCPSVLSHAFHRSLFVFVCRNVECSRTNDAANFAVFRCQLPKHNAYYGAERALNPWTDGDLPDPCYNESTFAKLCRVCGCRATKKCARCTQQWYCSKDHQVVDWSAGGHKLLCGKTAPNEVNSPESAKQNSASPVADESELADGKSANDNPFLFKEFCIEIDSETFADDDDDDEPMEHDQLDDGDSDDEGGGIAISEKELADKLKDLKKFENATSEISAKDLEGLEEAARDTLYKSFHRAARANPTQILRYEKGGRPLLATDHSPRPALPATADEILNGAKAVPGCELCGSPRQFEMQLMPHLLTLMDVDRPGHSIDWATLMVFTCADDCAIPDDGYAREFVFKQDFVDVVESGDEERGNKKA